MEQLDWVGHEPKKRKGFKDIRNTRDAVAEHKAQLCDKLRILMHSVPSALKAGGSINEVREFKNALGAAHKVYASARSSVFELEQQLNSLRQHYSVEDLLRLSVG